MTSYPESLELQAASEKKKAVDAIIRNSSKPKLPVVPLVNGWPEPLDESALHGLSGDIVRAIDPHIEGDPIGVLVQFLATFGNAAGRNAFVRVGGDRHFTNLFTVLVGETAKGRKGSSLTPVVSLMTECDSHWGAERVTSGLSSGEGLIWAVRDQIEEQEAIREPKTKRVIDYQTIVTDPGVTDKRLLDIETEFASVLRVAERDGNTLSAIIGKLGIPGTYVF